MPRRVLAVSCLLLALLPGCDTAGDDSGDDAADLVAYFETKRRFEPFAEALAAAGQDAALRSGGPITVLAPTDIAFESVGTDFLSILRQDHHVATLRRVLRTHLIPGLLRPEDFVDGAMLTTLDGLSLPVRRMDEVVLVGGARLDVRQPIERGGSIAYALDDVLLRGIPTADRLRLSPSLLQFYRAAQETGVLGAVGSGPVTVLAPLDDAYRALGPTASRLLLTSNADVRRRVTQAHVVPGLPPLTDGATWTTLDGDRLAVAVRDGFRTVGGRRVVRDEATADGRLLILDGVILAPLSLGQRLRLDDDLERYLAALARYAPALRARFEADGDGPFTVFAPTDAAHDLRNPDVTAALAEPESAPLNRRLAEVHVVEGRLMPADLTDGRLLTALDGTTLRVTRQDGTTLVDGRPVSTPRPTSNGVLYTLPGFLQPAVDALDTALLQGYTEHVRAVRRAGLEGVFRTPGLTAFIGPNELYRQNPGLLTRPDEVAALLRFNATYESLPTLPQEGRRSFTALDGRARWVGQVVPEVPPCTPGPDAPCPEPPPPPPPPYLGLDDGTPVIPGSPALDGSGFLHSFRTDGSFSFPSGPPPTSPGGRASR